MYLLFTPVFDHCSQFHSFGVKVLALGFWDGKSFVPLDFQYTMNNAKVKKQI